MNRKFAAVVAVLAITGYGRATVRGRVRVAEVGFARLRCAQHCSNANGESVRRAVDRGADTHGSGDR